MRATVTTLLAAALLVLPAVAGLAQVPDLPPAPPREEWYAANDFGYWSDGTQVRIDAACRDLATEEERVACSLDAFREKPFVVIGFTDTGINPYHQDFRADEFVHHPSEYIDGFPDDAQDLKLSFDVADRDGYHAATNADFNTWLEVGREQLYWFPGTRIIGAYSTGSGGTSGDTAFGVDVPVLDDQGHGTGVASVAAGRWYGSNPRALIVMVEGLGTASLEWATAQPWIDVLSNSWGTILGLPLGDSSPTRPAVERGQSVLFSAGNGLTNTNSSTVFDRLPVDDPCDCKTPDSNPGFTQAYGGPSWLLTIGAVSPANGQDHWWHTWPVDVSSFGSKWRSAHQFGVTREDSRDFGGTSNASPVTAGVLSGYLLSARERFGDTVGGQRDGAAVAVADGPADLPDEGPLADGTLTREEAEDVLLKTAFPVPFDPETYTWDYAVRPTTDLYYLHQGYGVVDTSARDRGLRALHGEDPLPDRSEVDEWIAMTDQIRDLMWPPG